MWKARPPTAMPGSTVSSESILEVSACGYVLLISLEPEDQVERWHICSGGAEVLGIHYDPAAIEPSARSSKDGFGHR